MDTFARQDIRQTNPRRQDLHPYLASLRGGGVFFDDRDHFRAAIARDNDSLVTHLRALRLDWQFWGRSDHGGEPP